MWLDSMALLLPTKTQNKHVSLVQHMSKVRVRSAGKPAFFVTSNLTRSWIIRCRWCLELPSKQLFKCQHEVPPARRVVAVPQDAVVVHHDDKRPDIFPLDSQLLQPVSLQLQVVVWQLFDHEAGRTCKQHMSISYFILSAVCHSTRSALWVRSGIRCVVSENIALKKSTFGIDVCATDFYATFYLVTPIQLLIWQMTLLCRRFSHLTCDSHWLLQTIFNLWPTGIKHGWQW